MGNPDEMPICFELDERQQQEFIRLTQMNPKDWDPELRAYVEKVAKRYGMPIEAVRCCALLDWVRNEGRLTRITPSREEITQT